LIVVGSGFLHYFVSVVTRQQVGLQLDFSVAGALEVKPTLHSEALIASHAF